MARGVASVLHLRDGRSTANPLERVRRFCDSEYRLYDAVDTVQDGTLTVHDMLLSVAVNSRLDAKGLSSIWRARDGVERHLRQISPTISLIDSELRIPWRAIAAMFEEFEHIKHAKLAVASKILHKKRPTLIPIMDDIVRRYYRRAYPDLAWSRKCGPLSGQLMRHARDDLLAARSQLESLASMLQTEGHPLTLVRLLEVLIWMEAEPKGHYRCEAS